MSWERGGAPRRSKEADDPSWFMDFVDISEKVLDSLDICHHHSHGHGQILTTTPNQPWSLLDYPLWYQWLRMRGELMKNWNAELWICQTSYILNTATLFITIFSLFFVISLAHLEHITPLSDTLNFASNCWSWSKELSLIYTSSYLLITTYFVT